MALTESPSADGLGPATQLGKNSSRLSRGSFVRLIPWIAAGVLFGAGVALFSLPERQDPQPREPPPPPLSVDESRLNFGRAWSRSDFKWNLPIKNETSIPIVVERLESSCYCTSASPSKFKIPPRQAVDVELTFDLSGSTSALPQNCILIRDLLQSISFHTSKASAARPAGG